jgi:hypothetical protein
VLHDQPGEWAAPARRDDQGRHTTAPRTRVRNPTDAQVAARPRVHRPNRERRIIVIGKQPADPGVAAGGRDREQQQHDDHETNEGEVTDSTHADRSSSRPVFASP